MVKQKKVGGAWYYEFMCRGKRHFGTCEGAKNQRQAEAFERSVREKATQAAGLKSVKALYETFREDLTGGKIISLNEAFELAMKKPRKRTPAEKQISIKRGIWQDFLDFMHGEHPEIVNLSDVRKTHAEEYVALIRESGKYNKAIQYSRAGKKRNASQTISYCAPENIQLSPRTTNYYQVVCTEVFNLLKDDAGLQENPFSGILKLDMKNETREAFSPDELKTIFDNLDGFTRPLFMMAVWTGLREGDICTLKWSDVDIERRIISRKTRKTGAKVQIPISDQLYDMLIAMPRTESEYVFPKHAEMYLANPSGVSYRVKQFLEGLGIETTRIPEGRTRAISVKDLHSCRHTFCYYAGRAAAIASVPIPLLDVVPLIANETYMIYRLAEVYGIPVDDTVITMILGCAGGSIAGKLAASLLPFLKIPIAAGITYGIGKAAKAYFESDMMLDKAELRETFLKEEREAKKREWKPVEDEDNSGDDDEISDDVHEPADELPEDCRVD